jgi:hypothetical protein
MAAARRQLIPSRSAFAGSKGNKGLFHNRSENEMDFGQESDLVLNVSRGQDSRWHVIVDDFHQPLASFDSPHDACAWAIARAIGKRGKVFVGDTLVDYSAELKDYKNASLHSARPDQ